MSSREANIINSARLPTLSTSKPKSGVAIMAESGSKLFNCPACCKAETWIASDADPPPCAARSLFVKRSIAKVRNGKIAEYPTPKAMMKERGSSIAAILIDGYYKGAPSRVQARFFHENQELCEPEIVPEAPILDRYDVHGSDKILNVFGDSEDPRLSKYGKRRGRVISSIENAIRFAHGYITACTSPEGLLIDSECPGIGGHIHVAIITPDEGFRWAPGYEPHGMI